MLYRFADTSIVARDHVMPSSASRTDSGFTRVKSP